MSDFQVGGHKGKAQLVPIGEFLYKPNTEQEANFYEQIQHSPLSQFLPKYYGKENIDLGFGYFTYFKMQNVIYGMKHPCILDLKMGCRTWFEDSSPEKIQSKKNYDINTTSTQYGLRFCGMRVFNKDINMFIQHDKYIMLQMHTYESLKQMIKVFLSSHGCINQYEKFKFSNSFFTLNDLDNIVNDLHTNPIINHSIIDNMIDKLLIKLNHLKEIYEKEGYQIISSSLFLFYDYDDPLSTIDFKMIDFAHWKDKNHKYEITDGYLIGIQTIITILNDLKLN
ncbi:transcription factor, putative [Entamoeba dispar SAW760]|uniref:Kinase n=1 Tax=Entamoeba dispar (strain ATCC PRA-260 / SAW760) TaxID=370354 RepID=B0E6C0_ENTDS|nr:transcription factor, putative [Entamoeba dispar SAW760]EDR29928.1 transcription factor, putative [Entamoeba dispar SAW760]|eukprot:EDR29928.1 transcription factor, putative [Entamoeba dispar SAW760]